MFCICDDHLWMMLGWNAERARENIKCGNNNVKIFCLICKRGEIVLVKKKRVSREKGKARFRLKSRTWYKSMPFNIYMLIVTHTQTFQHSCLFVMAQNFMNFPSACAVCRLTCGKLSFLHAESLAQAKQN